MPLALTINGIDGFNVGWSKSAPSAANITQIEDELSFYSDVAYQYWFKVVDVLPYSQYTFFVEHDGNIAVYDNDGITPIIVYTTAKSFSFSSGNRTKVKLVIGNAHLVGRRFTFKKPMLNLGTIPAPYEKKRGERMVMPVPKKNLLRSAPGFGANNEGTGTTVAMSNEDTTYFRTTAVSTVSTYGNPADWALAELVVGKTYTISCEVRVPVTGNVGFYGSRGVNNNVPAGKWVKISYSYTYSTFYRMLGLTYVSSTYIDHRNWQIEEGFVATPYELYAVQLNRKTTRALPVTRQLPVIRRLATTR